MIYDNFAIYSPQVSLCILDTKYTSFQRQLNLYGFRRLSKGEDQGSYFHPKFQRNRKDLLPEIRRVTGKTQSQPVAIGRSPPSQSQSHPSHPSSNSLGSLNDAQRTDEKSDYIPPSLMDDQLFDFDSLSNYDPPPSNEMPSQLCKSQHSGEHALSARANEQRLVEVGSEGGGSGGGKTSPPFDVEAHLAQYDKQDFMELIRSVIRDLEGGATLQRAPPPLPSQAAISRPSQPRQAVPPQQPPLQPHKQPPQSKQQQDRLDGREVMNEDGKSLETMKVDKGSNRNETVLKEEENKGSEVMHESTNIKSDLPHLLPSTKPCET